MSIDQKSFSLKKSELDLLISNYIDVYRKFVESRDNKHVNTLNAIKEIIDEKKENFRLAFNEDYDNVCEDKYNIENYDPNNIETAKKVEVDDESDDDFFIDGDNEEVNDDIDVFKNIDEAYDLVLLPSKGMIAPYKRSKLPISYLTAEDEDIITSPNLYENDSIMDYLLAKKIVDKNIKPDNLPLGDIDAIIVWLRTTSYGNMYPISVYDPTIESEFTVDFDLTTLKMKPFNLKSDEKGYFDFELPISKDIITFKFLTYGDNKKMMKDVDKVNDRNKKLRIQFMSKTITRFLENDEDLDRVLKNKLHNATSALDEWCDNMKIRAAVINNYITTKLERHIVAVNGNGDKKYISRYIKKMLAGDSLAFRRYLEANEPGIDFNIEVERPADLGGGLVKTFLNLDSNVFINYT